MADYTTPWDRIDDLESATTSEILTSVRKVSNTLNSMRNKIDYANQTEVHSRLGLRQIDEHNVRVAQYRAGLVYIAEMIRELLAR